MEHFKNEFCSELLRAGFTPEQANKALTCLAITMHGYNLSAKDANLVEYKESIATERLIQLYLDCKLVEGCSEAYIKNMGCMLKKIFDYIGKDVQRITSFDIREFLANWQKERKTTEASLNKYRQYINCFYQWLISEGYGGKNPCGSIKKIKEQKKEPEALSDMELEEVRMGAADDRERMVVEVLYGTACRVSELARAKLSDICTDAKQAYIKVLGKGKKERLIPMTAKALLAVKTYFQSRGFNSPYLCANLRDKGKAVSAATIRRLVKNIEDKVGSAIQHHLHPHLFRHTTITNLINHGMPVQQVQLFAGHSQINTTMGYAKIDKDSMMQNACRFIS